MNHERTSDQGNSSGKPQRVRTRERCRAANGFILLDALLILSAAAAAIAIAEPQALPVAPVPANTSAVVSTTPDPTHQADRASVEVDEQHEPLISDDLRADGAKYAWVKLPVAIGF